MIKKRWTFIVYGLVLVLGMGVGLPGNQAFAEMSELETFIRARIDIGQSMMSYMRELGSSGEYNPERGRPSMEQMQKMEAAINDILTKTLASYGLTIEEYEKRSPEVFADQAKVDAFLSAHPELKDRYEVLPPHRSRPPSGPS